MSTPTSFSTSSTAYLLRVMRTELQVNSVRSKLDPAARTPDPIRQIAEIDTALADLDRLERELASAKENLRSFRAELAKGS